MGKEKKMNRDLKIVLIAFGVVLLFAVLCRVFYESLPTILSDTCSTRKCIVEDQILMNLRESGDKMYLMQKIDIVSANTESFAIGVQNVEAEDFYYGFEISVDEELSDHTNDDYGIKYGSRLCSSKLEPSEAFAGSFLIRAPKTTGLDKLNVKVLIAKIDSETGECIEEVDRVYDEKSVFVRIVE